VVEVVVIPLTHPLEQVKLVDQVVEVVNRQVWVEVLFQEQQVILLLQVPLKETLEVQDQ
tara:strand:- start:1023 stop:1199 length:177 start_codon:yes stop_codon:yes gene_type:complete